MMNAALNITRTLSMSCIRYFSSVKLPTEIVIPINKDIIICWHPERKFPYECSLPLPEEKQISSDSVLCVGKKEIAEVFRKEKQADIIEKLSKITFTAKHRWYPKKRLARYKKIEPERPYL